MLPAAVLLLAFTAAAGSVEGRAGAVDTDAFSRPIAGLSEDARAAFLRGRHIFRQNWTVLPARDERAQGAFGGLGPLFDAQSCAECHVRDGRGRPADATAPAQGIVVRVARAWPPRGETPPGFGRQLNAHAIPGQAWEGRARVTYRPSIANLADGTETRLRRPVLEVAAPGGGPLPAAGLVWSLRVAPALIGLGLLEAIPAAAIVAGADPGDADGDGISGRVNFRPASRSPAPGPAGNGAIGRFGWKADRATLADQIAEALAQDLGIASADRPDGPCATDQQPCLAAQRRSGVEIDPGRSRDLLAYIRTLAPPEPRPPTSQSARGERIFAEIGCARCHRPAWTTAGDAPLPALADRPIAPFTDLLLHDMGPGLADGVTAGGAGGREWRTPPLWGVGLLPDVNGHQFLLHDGRARGVGEAILWHGGEARRARDAFARLPAPDRAALIAFVNRL